MYEHHSQAMLPREQFLRRVARHGGLSLMIIGLSLAIGTLGYRCIAQLPWVDAFLNASMILAGMGPVNALNTPAAKVFAALYALYSGIVFLAVAGILAAPFMHRILHRLHLSR